MKIMMVILLLSSVVFAQEMKYRDCANNERIHKMLPEHSTIKFNYKIKNNLASGVHFYEGIAFNTHPTTAFTSSVLLMGSDKSFRGEYAFVEPQPLKNAETADDVQFIFTPLQGQYLEISLYQKRGDYDTNTQQFITIGRLKEILGKMATLKAKCAL